LLVAGVWVLYWLADGRYSIMLNYEAEITVSMVIVSRTPSHGPINSNGGISVQMNINDD
jgi:hypothetical protein